MYIIIIKNTKRMRTSKNIRIFLIAVVSEANIIINLFF